MGEIKHIKMSEATIPNDGSVPTIRLLDIPFEQITPDIRLYYKTRDENADAGPGKVYGFDFYVAAFAQGSPHTPGEPVPDDIWHGDEVEIECVFHGIAHYDGIRHLWMGDVRSSNEGYSQYRDVRDLIKILEALDRMEAKYLEPEFHHRA